MSFFNSQTTSLLTWRHKVILNSLRLASFLGCILMRAGQALFFLVNKFGSPVWMVVKRVGFRWALLPAYKRSRWLFKLVGQLWILARKRVLVFVANRYTIHLVMGLITVFTALHNIYAQEIRVDSYGRGSVLYSLTERIDTGDEIEEIIVEEAVEDPVSLRTSLKPLRYSDYLAAVVASPGSEVDLTTLPATDTVALVQGGAAVVKPTEVFQGVSEDQPVRQGVENYIVQEGDTISSIAIEFGISVNTLLWENGLSARSLIRPGDSLRILPVSGVSHKVKSGETLLALAKKYDVPTEDIVTINHLDEQFTLSVNQVLVIPGAELIAQAPRISQPKPLPSRLGFITDIFRTAPNVPSGNQFLWPVVPRRITQYFRGYKHTGVDIGGKSAVDDIYAADDGVVKTSGWNAGGYGYRVVIDHGGGTLTLYAHMSKIFVPAGQKVVKGQVLGKVGSTGRSTGPHLHFEIIKNGARINPLAYY